MASGVACLEAELKFHDIESLKTATLKKDDKIKKLQMVMELAATRRNRGCRQDTKRALWRPQLSV